VVGRRPDGYHELESLFLPLDLADELELELEPAGASRVSLRLDGAAGGLPSDSRNLALRAAEGFLEAGGLRREVRIRLRKRIPAGAGLGGGSSDAAAVLRGLAVACPGALQDAALRGLALELGADVPFFLDPRPALVSGIGERCEPLAGAWPERILLLAHPGLALSTARVFAAYDGSGRRSGAPPLRQLLEEVRGAPRACGAWRPSPGSGTRWAGRVPGRSE
jgi:4-diphosphocytidyl-2-C-methyl-D-erythritol kinase